MDCMFSGKTCFLAEASWQKVARSRSNYGMSDEMHRFVEDMVFYMAKTPSILKDGYALREARRAGLSSPLTPDEIEQLAIRSLDLYTEFKVWGESLTATHPFPKEMLSPSDDAIFPVIFQHSSAYAFTFYTVWWACMLIVQEVLRVCGRRRPDDALNEIELVANICKSVENYAHGPFGGYKMGFSLRIAWEVADPIVRAWIVRWLERFSINYAAVSPDGLPNG